MTTSPIKIGLIAELTGPLSFMGQANANLTRMLVDDINAAGGLLGRRVELIVEDGETTDSVAQKKAAKLVDVDRVDVVIGGIYSSTRQAIKREAVTRAGKLYIYPEQYEGQEADPLIFCTGPVPAQQVKPLLPWLMKKTGAKRFYLPSADYIWPRLLNAAATQVVRANGGEIVGEEYFPLDHTDYKQTVKRIMESGADVVFNTIVPPGLTPFLAELHAAGFLARGGRIVCTYMDENFLNLVPAEHVEGLYSCLDWYQELDDAPSRALLARYNERFPGGAQLTSGSGCTGHYRAIKLWEAAVKEAGTVEQGAVIRALDHAQLREGPGGPAAMVPGQHHMRLPMHIAQARGGTFTIVERLGLVDPDEATVPARSAYAFPIVDATPAEARPFLEGPLKNLGFVPNLLLGLSNSTPTLASYAELGKQLAKTGLTAVEAQAVLIATSVENACAYCVAAHSTFATNAKIDPAALRALRAGTDVPDAKLDALATFVRTLVRTKGHVPDADLRAFVAAGYTLEQGLGVLVGVAMKTIANYGNHLMRTPLDPQFAAQRWEK